ncbi:hypothetical protein CI102_2144 [Trichoderma harzianum]|uniref:Uncharacterized protein n=1 Tax=Trichoderma harzianum CBS 226.95 TaxID=983964 RepID=A0A2T4AJ78_TRIHA|nr:hypothetical protein M431DRAFT_4214 [Trichoderma harzianum CBS 226.95]PKK52851.1 hypothetical protein CI102_2144 [Trichoderma harzianum]PTB57140.1 hypothetical protein M431DRAFT_4214 [Trichoderma harzianum CBS 226.95]
MQPTEIDDAHISVRFKYGIHTIFLFIDALAPFSSVTQDLLEVLRDRYPDGLTKSSSSPDEKTPVPDTANLTYGVLRVPTDPSKGWKPLKLGSDGSNTPSKCGIKDNNIVAFAFGPDEEDEMDADEGDVVFEVEWPQEDEELYEQGP